MIAEESRRRDILLHVYLEHDGNPKAYTTAKRGQGPSAPAEIPS
jgi:hypothetical protein